MLQVGEVTPNGGIAPHGYGNNRRRPPLRVLGSKVAAAGSGEEAQDGSSVATRRDMEGRKACAEFGIVDVDGGVGEELPHLVDIADIDSLQERRV
nr:hypothetical protein [Asticcacaulis tiandongensis]